MASSSFFTRPQAPSDIPSVADIESQVHIPASPAPAYTISSTRPPLPMVKTTTSGFDSEDDCTDAVDDFFGVTYTREERRARQLARLAQTPPTHASRHDAPIQYQDAVRVDEKAVSSSSCSAWENDIESASMVGTLPEYSEASKPDFEPFSIPQGLYKWGFYCPFFWFLGALLLFNFHSLTELVPKYSPEESALRVHALRRAERRWAGRCLLAWIIFSFFVLATAGIMYGLVMSLKN